MNVSNKLFDAPHRSSPQRMIQMAATKTVIATATTTTRFDHSKCSHARSGAEGKKARAACRKEHALAAAAQAERDAKKAARTPRKAAAPRAPRPAAPKPVAVENISVDA